MEVDLTHLGHLPRTSFLLRKTSISPRGVGFGLGRESAQQDIFT